ncbi:MAG: hypothetical protein COA78_14415 [Blastopirellula sp.]|nr:MAG: hypothetical protein COA78_14415 [Blastopirellula sp.]
MFLTEPTQDTTKFLDEFRSAQLSHLLVAAITEFDVASTLSSGPLSYTNLREKLKLSERSATVLLTALRSIELIDVDQNGNIALTEYGREKMCPESPFHLRGYLGLGAHSADVQNMIACLKHDRPAGDISFVYHEDQQDSALDDPETAKMLALAMSDRAKNVAPFLAKQLDTQDMTHLVDVGGGHGIYSYALMAENQDLQVTIIDRQPALDIAQQYAEEFNLQDRTNLVCADVHTIELDFQPDAVLMANLLHDYDVDAAYKLVDHFAQALAPQGRLMVLDAMLNSVPVGSPPVSTGPPAVAAYSGLLFSICEGRCYRFDEVQAWLTRAGLTLDDEILSLPAHGSLVTGFKR